MSELNKKNFYAEVLTHLEEIEALYEDHEFDDEDEDGEEGSEEYVENDALKRFINHIRDAKEISESY